MANKLYDEASVQAIANAIRAKNGSTETYTIAEMAPAIQALTIGGGGLEISGFYLAGGKISTLSGNNLTQAARTVTHNLKKSDGTAIVPNAIFIYDPNTYYTMSGNNGYMKSIIYDLTNKKYYRRVISNSKLDMATINCTSDTTGVKVGTTTFELPNVQYYAMHNFCWIAIGTDSSLTTEQTCVGGYTN